MALYKSSAIFDTQVGLDARHHSKPEAYLQGSGELTLRTKDHGPEKCSAFGFNDIAFPAQDGYILAAAGISGQVACEYKSHVSHKPH